MKKLSLIILLLAGTIIFSCKKEIKDSAGENTEQVGSEDQSKPPVLTKLDYFKLLAEKFLLTAQSSVNFKKWIYSSCFAQDSGDYYVSVANLVMRDQGNPQYWTNSERNYLKGILDNINSIDIANGEKYTEPMVFVPFIEDLDIDSLLLNCPTGVPEAVISMQYDTTTTYCPGYTLQNNNSPNSLVQVNSIGETYAWSHDVWVFGQEEVFDNSLTAGRPSNSSGSSPDVQRVNGRAEYGGIIQVTDMGKLESWVAGKFEFRYYVFNAFGTKIKDRKFSSVKRKDIKNLQWKDFNDFIGNWNTSNIGNFMIEGWVELDGGTSTSTTSFTIPPACTGCSPISVSINRQNQDQDMGQSIVQFTDPVQPTDPTSTVYNITYANFRRRH